MLHDLWRAAYGLVVATVWLASLPGCRTPPAEENPRVGGIPPGVRATVTTGTADRESYTGTGEFGVNDADGVNQPKTFSMNSRSQEGPGGRSLNFWRYQGTDRTPPAVGTYAVVLPDYRQARWPTMAAAYHTEVDGWMEAYVGQRGTVTITESSPERFAGRFRFTAVRYYRRPMRGTGREPGMVLGRPSEVPPGQPTIEITGTFVASPSRPMIVRPAG